VIVVGDLLFNMLCKTGGCVEGRAAEDQSTRKVHWGQEGSGQSPEARPRALDMISRLEPSRGPSHAHWWHIISPQLAVMLEETGYPVEKQLEILTFLYHWVVCCFLQILLLTRAILTA
jgi:hypothetical protein